MLRCPSCYEHVEQDWVAKLRTVRLLDPTRAGAVKCTSQCWDFQPGEVGEARAVADRFGQAGLGQCIGDNGSVRFDTRAQGERFSGAMSKYQQHHHGRA